MKKHLLTNSYNGGGGITNLKRNAFTLIELLAIIVILAIIAVITVPIILNIIENSRKGAAADSALGYKDAVNKFYVSEIAKNPSYTMPNGTYTVNGANGYLEGTGDLEGNEPLRVEVSGQKPNSGGVELEKNTIKQACLKFGDYAVTITNGSVGEAVKGPCNGTLVQGSSDNSSEQNNSENNDVNSPIVLGWNKYYYYDTVNSQSVNTTEFDSAWELWIQENTTTQTKEICEKVSDGSICFNPDLWDCDVKYDDDLDQYYCNNPTGYVAQKLEEATQLSYSCELSYDDYPDVEEYYFMCKQKIARYTFDFFIYESGYSTATKNGGRQVTCLIDNDTVGCANDIDDLY